MTDQKTKTKKGAAAIYIVIFTTTLLGVIVLSFVRIMLNESNRTMNYSLSQSAYNSALAGVEDAKIVLLRYQNCLASGKYTSSSSTAGSGECSKYINAFSTKEGATQTAKKCDTVGDFLHPYDQGSGDDKETVIQTSDANGSNKTGASVVDQAYTCVKISTYTDDFLAILKEDAPSKLVPLRTESEAAQKSINRIQIEWFDQDNYNATLNKNGNLITSYSGIGSGTLTTPATAYVSDNNSTYSNSFGAKPIVPPVLQVSYIQTAKSFNVADFYASEGIGNTSKTNRGTLMLRPSNNTTLAAAHKVSTGNSGNRSNVLPQNSIAYSANKSLNTPVDVYCNSNPNSFATWGTYACLADFFVPDPIGSNSSNSRSMTTNYLVVNLPYGAPETDIAVKMYSCKNAAEPISKKDDKTGETNCSLVDFANVQPMVDSTGRANDLFRRVESRIELADTNFPIANYALAVDGNTENDGIIKNFYATNDCSYSSSTYINNDVFYATGSEYKNLLEYKNGVGTPANNTCPNASGKNGS